MNPRNDVMERLAAACPAALDPDPARPRRAADLRKAMGAAEQEDIVLTPADPVSEPGRPGRPERHWRRRRPWLIPLLAAGLTGAVIATGLVAPDVLQRTVDPSPDGPASEASQGDARRAALVMAARAERLPEPAPGRFWQSRARTITLNQVAPDRSEARIDENLYAVNVTSEQVEWTPRDGRAEPVGYERLLGFEPRTAADAAAWRASGSPPSVIPTGLMAVRPPGDGRSVSREPGPWTAIPSGMRDSTILDRDEENKAAGERKVPIHERLRMLPTDPRRLRGDLFCPPRWSKDCVDFMTQHAYDLTGRYAVSPKLRAAVIRMLLAEPRVIVTANAVDPLGRRGIGLAVDTTFESPPTFRKTIVLNSRTGEPLGFTMTVIKGLPKSGHQTGQTPFQDAVVGSGWTNSPPETPR